MSAVPARPSSPDSRSRASPISPIDSPPRSASHTISPGSTLPDRVAIGSPSSGVKPIVVSMDRPPATAASDAPAPRWQVTIRRSAGWAPSISAARRAA